MSTPLEKLVAKVSLLKAAIEVVTS